MAELRIRFVNRNKYVVTLPNRRGGRTALAPGEFVTDPYFERFSKLATDRDPSGQRRLTKEYSDGTIVGQEPPPKQDRIEAPFTPHFDPVQVPPPPGGCETSCEAACQFPNESLPAAADQINRQMDKGSLADTMVPSAGTLEPGIAPPMPSLTSELKAPDPTPASPTAPPPVLSGMGAGVASYQQVTSHFKIDDEDVLEVSEHFVKAMLENKEQYLSRLELGWKTESLPAMKRHVTSKQGVS